MVAASTAGHHRPPPPRNILLITIDTLRADALGAYGNASAATPWMDRLAAGGLRFSNAHAHNVVTLPSHANILTGRLPPEHGVRDNAGFRLAAGEATLATRLEGARVSHRRFHQRLSARLAVRPGPRLRRLRRSLRGCGGASGVSRTGTRGYRDRAAARRWLQARSEDGEPWFGWVHLYEPHYPVRAARAICVAIRARPYAGEVAAADAALGPLLQPILDAGAATRHARGPDRGSRRVARRSRRGDARHLRVRSDAEGAAHRLLPPLLAPRVIDTAAASRRHRCRRSRSARLPPPRGCAAAAWLICAPAGQRQPRSPISKRCRDRSIAAGRRSLASSRME